MNILRNILIGSFFCCACLFIIGFILAIKPKTGDEKQIIHVYFSNISNISTGTIVTYAGQPIGKVAAITQVPSARNIGMHPSNQVYPYLLILHIDSHYVIYTSDEITVHTQGLLGEKYITIVPKPIKEGSHAHRVTRKDFLYANSNDLLETTLNEISSLSTSIEDLLVPLFSWFHENSHALNTSVQKFYEFLKEVQEAMATFNQLHIMEELKRDCIALSDTAQQMGHLLEDFNKSHTLHNLEKISAYVKNIAKNIDQGQGSIGKIFQEEDLYWRIQKILKESDQLLRTMNQYGVLYQYNRKWQRAQKNLSQKNYSIYRQESPLYVCQKKNCSHKIVRALLSIDKQFYDIKK